MSDTGKCVINFKAMNIYLLTRCSRFFLRGIFWFYK